jgi:hypothetical protein
MKIRSLENKIADDDAVEYLISVGSPGVEIRTPERLPNPQDRR